MAIAMEVQLKLLIVFAGIFLISAQIGPVVKTSLGKIRGSILRTEKNNQFFAFRGIRYAEAPTGAKRFSPPIAMKSWFGELDATQDGFMCPQTGQPLELISEDCLCLNVYSKNLTDNRSVLVYIHGGSNNYGGSHSIKAAGPEYLMESDLVVVTMNFRLGALGYLSTQSKEAPGNYGYLDQVMALQWVHDHISKFGGNPHSVTIFGISSGARAVTLHMASPLSQGLFHKVIAMSGSATNANSVQSLKWTQKLAHDTSCPMFNPIDTLDCLRKLPWQTIVNVTESWQAYNLVPMNWLYEIDGHFLTKDPTTVFAEGNFSRVPLMTGISKDEFTYMILSQENNTGLLNDMSLNFDKYAPELFVYNFDDEKVKRSEKIKEFYLGNKTIVEQDFSNFGKIFAEARISHGVHSLVQLARKYVDVFYYRFDYQGRFASCVDWEGKPKAQIVEGVKWLPSNRTAVNTLYIDEQVEMGNEPYPERFQLWDRLFPLGKSDSGLKCSES